MVSISGLVSTVINQVGGAALRSARHALDRIAPEAAAPAATARALQAPRKSKGWRKHVRATKARQSAAARY